jgi:hypothetical protein
MTVCNCYSSSGADSEGESDGSGLASLGLFAPVLDQCAAKWTPQSTSLFSFKVFVGDRALDAYKAHWWNVGDFHSCCGA